MNWDPEFYWSHSGTAFSDSRVRGVGGEVEGTRHSMLLFNLVWKTDFFWDGRASSLRDQIRDSLTDPDELGNADLAQVATRLDDSDTYPVLFTKAFGDEGITGEAIILALENFLISLTSQDSKVDRAIRGEVALKPAEQRGFDLFFTEYEPRMNQRGADCFHCHGGPLFSGHQFRNNGLPPLEGGPEDLGRELVTGRPADRHKFAVPSLRNVALTAPCMHDGPLLDTRASPRSLHFGN